MTEQSRKWTRGPATVRDLGHGISVEPSIAWCGDTTAHRYSETKANGALIAEAFNVATETGLTPRQLAERIVELEAALLGLEVTANTLAYCYERRPENFAVALRDLNEHAALARAALRTEPRT